MTTMARTIIDTCPSIPLVDAARIISALPTQPKRWGVTATITRWHGDEPRYQGTTQVPYFELNSRVQGCITSEQAHNVAYAIVADILGVSRESLVTPGSRTQASVTVVPVSEVTS